MAAKDELIKQLQDQVTLWRNKYEALAKLYSQPSDRAPRHAQQVQATHLQGQLGPGGHRQDGADGEGRRGEEPRARRHDSGTRSGEVCFGSVEVCESANGLLVRQRVRVY